ncbi:hypothetical protein [Acinetobacter sp. G11]|uniref:hypothetical protein n=1 Tax=Acinetobacter sp. G11 TaxID=3415989 RepID=UPI003C7D7CC1
MKKLILALVAGGISTFSAADKPLLIQQGTPVPLNSDETPVAETYYKPLQPARYKNQDALNSSLMLEYSAQKGKFTNSIDEDLNGFGVGFSSSPHKNGLWGKIEYQENSKYNGEAYEFSFGGHLNLIDANGFYALGTIGTGVSILDVEGFDTSSYWTLPIGLEIGYTFVPSLSIYGGVGYKWSWDVSSSTTCKNGTQSNSVGSGTCSWNGGIDHYNYTIGDYDGVTYKAGIRYNF